MDEGEIEDVDEDENESEDDMSDAHEDCRSKVTMEEKGETNSMKMRPKMTVKVRVEGSNEYDNEGEISCSHVCHTKLYK